LSNARPCRIRVVLLLALRLATARAPYAYYGRIPALRALADGEQGRCGRLRRALSAGCLRRRRRGSCVALSACGCVAAWTRLWRVRRDWATVPHSSFPAGDEAEYSLCGSTRQRATPAVPPPPACMLDFMRARLRAEIQPAGLRQPFLSLSLANPAFSSAAEYDHYSALLPPSLLSFLSRGSGYH